MALHIHMQLLALGTLLESFNCKLFDNPPYSPDMAPSNCHLFTYLHEEFMEDIRKWLSPQVADFLDSQEHILQYGKCFSSSGDYVEKCLLSSCTFFLFACFVNSSPVITF
jgi:hypothetical protein